MQIKVPELVRDSPASNPVTFFVVRLDVFRLPGDGIQLISGLPPGLIDFAFFLLGKLLIGNEFFHNTTF